LSFHLFFWARKKVKKKRGEGYRDIFPLIFPSRKASVRELSNPSKMEMGQRTRSVTPPMPEELRFGYGLKDTVRPDAVAEIGDKSADGGRSAPAVVIQSSGAGEERGGTLAAKGKPSVGGEGRRRAPAAPKMSMAEAVVEEADFVQYKLSFWEVMLVRACHRVLGSGLGHTAALCREAHVTVAQIEAHAKEIGVVQKLRPDMLQNLVKFVQFMHLLEKLKVIKFEYGKEGRTVLGYDMISIVENSQWRAVIEAICGKDKYFRAKSTVYEMLLKFGFGGHRDVPLPEDMMLTGNSTEHKEHVLLYCSTFFFDEVKLGRNLKRYTNSQTKVWGQVQVRDGLSVLLAAAENALGREGV
jgi:hypothetical protein